jgi:serine/threonine protein kinase
MIDFIVDQGSKTPSIVYEYLDVVDWRELYPKLTDTEIRFYMYQILKVLINIKHIELKFYPFDGNNPQRFKTA